VIDCWAVANQLDKARDVLARAERALTLTLDFYCSLGVLLLTRHAPPARMNPLAIPARQAQPTDGAWVELATELLDRAVALDPEDAQTRLRIATELMSIRPDLALRYAEEGVRLAPADPRTLMLLGLLLGLNERSREAKDVMRRAARLARQQGDQELARNIDSLRQQVDSPFLSMLLRLGPLVEDLDLDDEPFW
jgi:tetratricopeptide (TPR) repeat protein